MEWIFFLAFGLVAAVAAVAMVLQRSPIYSALYLILALFAQAGLYILLGAELIAAVHIIVYAGAIMVLFLFVIMLLDLGRADRSPARVKPVGVIVGTVLAGLLLAELAVGVGPQIVLGPRGAYDPEVLRTVGNTRAVGRILFREYLIPFELTSLILLTAMVGAMVLAKRKVE
ncbi:MAG TPA: NADH-quinone oxidoreductase subunit J [Candidatus Methylomirabilis sp.]|nr:NADH-quinone oxidoreductase subunit J [Candidatus Methylomirabilis sp.]